MDGDAATGWAIEGGQKSQQDTLARAVGARHAEGDARCDAEGDVLEDGAIAEAAGDMVDHDGGFARGKLNCRPLVDERPFGRRRATHLIAPTAVTSNRFRRTSRTVVDSDASRV